MASTTKKVVALVTLLVALVEAAAAFAGPGHHFKKYDSDIQILNPKHVPGGPIVAGGSTVESSFSMNSGESKRRGAGKQPRW
ncbi:hypothetical protein Hamer_G017297 [Homarus americanus]|uniref:Uncharacterized protein n=1 Tax=Homarus americanus TaxID=6706 RepID=A0A8J5K050_HOMAM|nr:hypothetical protein Hamer_G017297 [Homarus americanus]